MQKDSYALFVDNSGSVGGSDNYWNTVRDIVDLYAKDIQQYYLWDSTCNLVDLKHLQNSINIKEGIGGTSPQNVALEIVKKSYTHIILVTDGEVGDYSVKACDLTFDKAENQSKFKILKSICYIVSTSKSPVNMSVTCPFSRSLQSKIFTKTLVDPLLAVVQYTAEDYKILDTLEQITLGNFQDNYDLIQSLIIALNMGKAGNIPLKNQLVVMKNRMVKQLSKMMVKQNNYSQQIKERLQNKDFNGAISIAKKMTDEYFTEDMTTSLQKRISHLINLCGDLTGKYNIGQIKSNKMAIALNAQQGQLDQNVEINDLSKHIIECPIILDEDVPQILIDQCQPLLLGVDKYIVDDIAACPLRILNYPEIKAKLKASISTFTGTKYADKLLKNPFTQNRLLGAIPLGTHPSHVKVGDFTIAKLISGGKVLGNLNMYFAVIWHLISQGEIQYLKPIQKNADEHLIYRLKTSKTMAGMCGLAQFVTTQVTTDVAVWYCVNSGYLNQPTKRDIFRFHLFNLEPMIKILNLLGYPVHEGLYPHYYRTKAMMIQLSRFKKMNNHEKATFKQLCKGIYQRGFFVDTFGLNNKFKDTEVCPEFILVDGEPTVQQIAKIKEKLSKQCQNLSSEQFYYISTFIDAQKSASDIFLDYNLKVPDLPKALMHWCYGIGQQKNSKVQFNPKTMRPYYRVQGVIWQDIALQTFHAFDIKQLFSGCRYLIQFVVKYEKIPSQAELIIFYYNRYIESSKTPTLPYLTKFWTNELITKFKNAADNKDINKILTLIDLSRNRLMRDMIESGKNQQMSDLDFYFTNRFPHLIKVTLQ